MSYYRKDRKLGKIIATFPGPVALFWWLSRRPEWGRYKGEGAEAWELERRETGVRRVVLAVLAVVGTCGGLVLLYLT